MICVYTIIHPTTDVYYIGSTVDFHPRLRHHLSTLNSGKHTAVKLQEAYDTNPNIEWSTVPMLSEEAARLYEYEQIRRNEGDPLMSNRFGLPLADSHKMAISASKIGKTHTDETISRMSASRTGVSKSPEWIDKIVDSRRMAIIVDGVRYRSATEAGKAFNTSARTAIDRAKNKSPKFNNWQFAKD